MRPAVLGDRSSNGVNVMAAAAAERRMDSGIRGHAAAIVDREKGGNGTEQKGRA